jgi:integrase
MRGEGRVFKRGVRWWISYYAPRDGKSVNTREPAVVVDGLGRPSRAAKTEAEARRALKKRRDEVGAHRIGARQFRGPEQERLLLTDLLDALERDYESKKLASLGALRSRLKQVRAFFDGYSALAVNASEVRAFIGRRRQDGAAEATVQRELETIRRVFSLAAEDGKLTYTPVIPALRIGDTNARQGFLPRADFEALLSQLGEERGRGDEKRFVPDVDLQDFTLWAWWTGMRKGEAAALTWEAFDREAWTVTLHARDAKTRKARTLALEGPLREILERRIRSRRLDCPLIFHRGGLPVREFRRAWSTATRRAGLPGVLFHDLRRSAIRNMVRAGVDPAVAMRISGHRTDATFRRYNILDETDLRDAMVKTSEYVSALPKERKTAALPHKTEGRK